MQKFLDFFGSLKLTLAVLLGLALISVAGTIKPAAPGRFDLFYQAPWFRLLLGLLAINLLVCTWRTLVRNRGLVDQLLRTLERQPLPAVGPAPRVPGVDSGQLVDRLRQKGYRTQRVGDRLLASRGLGARWSVPVLHLAILAIMGGGLASELGFVGTINIYVSHATDEYFDWEVEELQPLGFTFRLDHFEPRYYPIELRFATIDPATRTELATYTAFEGETVDLGGDLSVELVRFYPEEQHLVLNVLRNGVPVGEYHALSGQRRYPDSVRLDREIRPVAYRDPILKQLHSRVSILENGRVVRQGVIEVNHPLVHRGVAIYQTAYSRDESGFWTCGFQLSKDPGEPVVWVGSVILSLALVMVFLVRPRAVGLIRAEDGWRLIPLRGFRGEGGVRRLEELAGSLGANPSGTEPTASA